MIRRLAVEGITVFPQQVAFDFVPGINVIVGSNDSGKSHLMKLCYALLKWAEKSPRREFPETWAEEGRLRRCLLQAFGAQDLAAITSHRAEGGHATVRASMQGEKVPIGCADLVFELQAQQDTDRLSVSTMPQRFLQESALFIPPREVLSLFPCYLQLGKRYPVLPDGTGRDLCCALETASDSGSGNVPEKLRRVLRMVELLLHGRLQRMGARFLLQRTGEPPMELSMVAEGLKRPGTLGLLIDGGVLRPGCTVFWDEPEMNLNTAHLPLLCGILLGLCDAGVQVVITTHSLFLLRELTIGLSKHSNRSISRRFIGLQVPASPHEAVHVTSGDSPDEIGPPESLQAEMEQADRYLRMSNLPYPG